MRNGKDIQLTGGKTEESGKAIRLDPHPTTPMTPTNLYSSPPLSFPLHSPLTLIICVPILLFAHFHNPSSSIVSSTRHRFSFLGMDTGSLSSAEKMRFSLTVITPISWSSCST